ncbi:MAG: hypothetical protein HY901_28550, partial [Deltaproteobacteria bacterium]|nr:hypothetical protein [Deltaproteobacteria bacterium]
MPMRVGHVSESIAKPRIQKLGDTLEVQDPSRLPKSPPGTEWKLTGNSERMPPTFQYTLVAKKSEPSQPAPAKPS